MAIVNIKVWNAVDSNGGPSRICVADPGKISAGDTVRWSNQTGDDIIVFFPHDNVLGNSTKHFFHKIGDKSSHHHTGSATKKNSAGPPERYPYAIYCVATGRFAVGGSDPEMIIT